MNRASHLTRVVLTVALASGYAWAQTTECVSTGTGGSQGNSSSHECWTSGEGRYVAFSSSASNLVPNDTNGWTDIFVRDRQSGVTERVSVATSGVEGNFSSQTPSISADGRHVTFLSYASNLVAGDTNGFGDIFVRDRQSGTTERVSISTGGIQADSNNHQCSISADGRFVAFNSFATNLVPGDTNFLTEVFVRDLQAGTTERVSVTTSRAEGNAASLESSISADGRFVAFRSSATNLIAGGTSGHEHIFVRDRVGGTTELISQATDGTYGAGESFEPSISADGQFVAFRSTAQNLVPGQINGNVHVFVRDRLNAATERVSVTTSGVLANGASLEPAISADGRFVAFHSYASNLVASDTNGLADVFVHDRQLGTTDRMSVDSSGGEATSDSMFASISANGQIIGFQSNAPNLVANDTGGWSDIFIHSQSCTGSPSVYCSAKHNSIGCLPQIESFGVPATTGGSSFSIRASNLLNQKLGMLLWSFSPASSPFGGCTLCLQQPIIRTAAQNSGGSATGLDCSGIYSFEFSQTYMVQQLLSSNTTVFAQYWSRDPGFAVPNNIGLTDALRFTICP